MDFRRYNKELFSPVLFLMHLYQIETILIFCFLKSNLHFLNYFEIIGTGTRRCKLLAVFDLL